MSARLAQIGRNHAHCNRLAQNLDQHHDSALAIGHLVNAFDAGQTAIKSCDQHTSQRSSPLQIDDNGRDTFITEQPAEKDGRLLIVKAAVRIENVE